MKNIIYLIFVICAHSYVVKGLTDDEMRAYFARIIIKCTKDHPVDMKELFKLQKLVIPQDSAVTCLLACAYKREGVMTDKGMYDLKHAFELVEMAKNGDEERSTNGKKVAEICAHVNEAKVSDGEKGCERAALMFKCGVEHLPKYGFKLM